MVIMIKLRHNYHSLSGKFLFMRAKNIHAGHSKWRGDIRHYNTGTEGCPDLRTCPDLRIINIMSVKACKRTVPKIVVDVTVFEFTLFLLLGQMRN